MTLPRVGLGWRSELAAWIDSQPAAIDCLEITADHFYRFTSAPLLRRLSRSTPLLVHGLSLSLGTPGPLDRGQLDSFASVVAEADPLWVSEHIGFSRTAEVDLGHFNPVCPNEETLFLFAEHARDVAERCGKPLILENISTHLRIRGTLAETEFLNRLSEESGCGLLLDVTNLYVNARNHGFDPYRWLADIDPQRIVQLHVVGYTQRDEGWHDLHEQPIQDDLWDLIRATLLYAPVQAIILERDKNFPHPRVLEQELAALKTLARACASERGGGTSGRPDAAGAEASDQAAATSLP